MDRFIDSYNNDLCSVKIVSTMDYCVSTWDPARPGNIMSDSRSAVTRPPLAWINQSLRIGAELALLAAEVIAEAR